MSVTLNPGDDIAAAIAANPNGTEFLLAAGAHRLIVPFTPKPGNSFIGPAGYQGSSLSPSTLTTTLSGARVLTGWTDLGGGVWSKGGQTQSGTVIGSVGTGECLISNPMCGYPEDLFFNDVIKLRVATLGEVAPGKWFFNLATDTVYVGDDPTSATVEISVSPTAMEGSAANVTIKYLRIEKFATPTSLAPIDVWIWPQVGTGLIIQHCEFRYNHCGGLPANGLALISNNYSHHNGGLGAQGGGPVNVIEDNEFAYNGGAYNSNFQAGGTKWVFSDGMIVRRNWSHHNYGPGLWTDIDNVDALYEYNLVEDNETMGIFHEISGAAIIRYNTIKRNGTAHPVPGYVDGAGILVSSSFDVEVYHNRLVDNWQGICGLEAHRGSGTIGPYELRNLNVHDNITVVTLSETGGYRQGVADTSGTAAWGALANNRYENNHYAIPADDLFFWQAGDMNEAAWHVVGHDVGVAALVPASRHWPNIYWPSRYWPKAWGGSISTSPNVFTVTVEALLAGTWTNLTADVHAETGIRIKSGIDGNGPLDCVASPGECLFALNNSAAVGRLLGAYSPLHANCRADWTWGVPIRVTAYDPTTATIEPLHRGKAWVIDPIAGQYGERLVHVASYDGLYDLMDVHVELGIFTDRTESELIAAILDAVPAASQPVGRDLDVGVDTFDFAFHDLGSGENALSLIKDIAVDSGGFVAMRGDGTFVFRNRHTRVNGVSEGTFSNTMTGFTAPSSLDQAFNKVRVGIRPPRIDPMPTSILYADEAVRSLEPGTTQEFWVPFSDQTDPSRSLIGGLVSGLNYGANGLIDGTGLDLSASLLVAMYAVGSSARLTLTNIHDSLTIYVVDSAGLPYLQIVGTGYSEGVDQIYEASSVQAYPTRQLDIALRYQSRPAIAQGYATFTEMKWHSLQTQPQTMRFVTTGPTALMTHALARDVGGVITVGETMTGYSGVDAFIQSKEIEIRAGSIVSCQFSLAPVARFKSWKLGVPGRMGLGIGQTILGF